MTRLNFLKRHRNFAIPSTANRASYAVTGCSPTTKQTIVVTIHHTEDGIDIVGNFPAHECKPDREIDVVYRLSGGAQARLLVNIDYLENLLTDLQENHIKVFTEEYMKCEPDWLTNTHSILLMLADLELFLRLYIAELKREDYQTKITNS